MMIIIPYIDFCLCEKKGYYKHTTLVMMPMFSSRQQTDKQSACACMSAFLSSYAALRAVEMYDDLGLQLCGHACNELMEALGGTRAGDGGRGDGLNPLRLMYRLLDVMCRAGLQPSPRTAHVMCSAVLNGSTAAEPGSGATAAATVLKEFEANGVVVSQESWDAVEHAGYLRDTTTTASTL